MNYHQKEIEEERRYNRISVKALSKSANPTKYWFDNPSIANEMQLSLGCLQRIADAIETIASKKFYPDTNEVTKLKRKFQRKIERCEEREIKANSMIWENIDLKKKLENALYEIEKLKSKKSKS